MKIKEEFTEFKLLLKSTPSLVLILFIMSVLSMNLLANKSINLPFSWIALDCGIVVSWVSFLTMDILTKHFGPKAATQLSIFAIGVNLLFCLIFWIGSIIPGVWGESFADGSENIINTSLNNTFGGTWYVVLGSTIAFIVSSFVNNFSNWGIGKLFKSKENSRWVFFLRSYVSTALGQFLDNLTFAFIVSHFFFGWTILQCITCALTGMIVELLCEVVFSYFGLLVCNKWKKDQIGEEYFNYCAGRIENK